MNQVLAAETAVPERPHKTDFADWLSPILVKELRQGLKSKVFVGTFIVMQVIMVITMGLRLLNQSEYGAGGGTGFDAFFWALIVLPLMLVMPARGLTAVSEEAKASTFDLLQLTRMTAFRIAFGKWIALVAQTVLLVAALLPYAVLRYYFGRVDILGDLGTIGHLLMSSMVLTAGGVALSAAPLVVRILVLILGIPSFIGVLGQLTFFMAFRGGGPMIGGAFDAYIWILMPLSTALYVFMLLEFAAAKFAPDSENHPARKRTSALVMGMVLAAACWLGGEEWFAITAINFFPLMAWVLIEALTETSLTIPVIYGPFARRGFFGRMLGRILYPGWATGILFTALIISLIMLAFSTIPGMSSGNASESYLIILPMLFLALLSPLPIMLLFPRFKQRFWLYVLIQGLYVLIYLAFLIIRESPLRAGSDVYHWLSPLPTCALLAMLSENNSDFFLFQAGGVFGLFMLAFLGVHMLREFKKISVLERASIEPKTPAAS